MPKPFFNRLQNYYSQIGKVLKGEADSASIFPNSSDIGTSREKVYASVLQRHLPSSCNVFLGGFLFDLDGNESKQIDIIVCNNQNLQFNFHNTDNSGKSFSCIEGCVAVVSVKSNLSSAELVDSLENLASLPRKRSLVGRHNPLLEIKQYEEWPYKVIYASNGAELETIISTVKTFYADHPDIPYFKKPNAIHVVGKYFITRIGIDGDTTREGAFVAPHSFHCLDKYPDEFGLPFVVGQIQKINMSTNHIIYSFDDIWNNLPLE